MEFQDQNVTQVEVVCESQDEGMYVQDPLKFKVGAIGVVGCGLLMFNALTPEGRKVIINKIPKIFSKISGGAIKFLPINKKR